MTKFEGLEFRIYGSESNVKGLGFRIEVLGFTVQGFTVQGSGFRDERLGLRLRSQG